MNTPSNLSQSRSNFTGVLIVHLILITALFFAFRTFDSVAVSNWAESFIVVAGVAGALAWAWIAVSMRRAHAPTASIAGAILLSVSTAAWAVGSMSSALHSVLVWSGVVGMLLGALVLLVGVRSRAR